MTPYVVFSREFLKKRREELQIVFARPGRKPQVKKNEADAGLGG